MLRALLITLGLSSTACSLVVVRGPPPDAGRRPYLECTANPTAPIIDSVITAAMVAALASVAGGQQDGTYPTNYAGALVSTGIGVLGFGGSAAYGYLETARCRDAYDQLQQRLNSPPRWVPPPPPRFIPPPPGVAPQPAISAPAVQPPREAPMQAPAMVAPTPAAPASPRPSSPKPPPSTGESQALPFDSDDESDKRGSQKPGQKKSEDDDSDEDESDDEDSGK